MLRILLDCLTVIEHDWKRRTEFIRSLDRLALERRSTLPEICEIALKGLVKMSKAKSGFLFSLSDDDLHLIYSTRKRVEPNVVHLAGTLLHETLSSGDRLNRPGIAGDSKA